MKKKRQSSEKKLGFCLLTVVLLDVISFSTPWKLQNSNYIWDWQGYRQFMLFDDVSPKAGILYSVATFLTLVSFLVVRKPWIVALLAICSIVLRAAGIVFKSEKQRRINMGTLAAWYATTLYIVALAHILLGFARPRKSAKVHVTTQTENDPDYTLQTENSDTSEFEESPMSICGLPAIVFTPGTDGASGIDDWVARREDAPQTGDSERDPEDASQAGDSERDPLDCEVYVSSRKATEDNSSHAPSESISVFDV